MGTTKPLLDGDGIFSEGCDLRVEVAVTPSSDCSCPIASAAESEMSVEDVRRKTSKSRCESDLVVDGEDGGEVVNAVTAVEDDCFCPVFEKFGVLPKVEEVRGDEVVVSAYVSDRRDMKTVLEGLRSTVDDVRLVSIKDIETRSGDAEVGFSDLTDKQHDTLRRAVVGGYYDDPQEMSLDELADDFGVSKSAISQRLSRAEAKLATRIFDRQQA